jgi:hypothetical protein
MAKIIFYHQPHTRINGEPAHGKHEFDSIAQPSFFAPQMSQALKDHIHEGFHLGFFLGSFVFKKVSHSTKSSYVWWFVMIHATGTPV